MKWLRLKTKKMLRAKILSFMPAEILNTKQMERHANSLARSHTLTQKPTKTNLLERLSNSEQIIKQTCTELSHKTKGNTDTFPPAKEWLLDNFYLIQEHIHTIGHNLPKSYGKTLPQLAGSIPGYPRIYDIALQIIKHSDGRWDLETLECFITAYQEITALTLGELWAIPITLGIALIENLANACLCIITNKNERALAHLWADRMIEASLLDPKKLVQVLAEMTRSDLNMNSAYVSALEKRLRGAGLTLPINWIEQQLAEEGLTIEALVQEQAKYQANIQISISNSIAGLRNLDSVDWRKFVESMSIVEKILRLDPSQMYPAMDFETRDHYRHVIEHLSKISSYSETEISDIAIQLAKNESENILKSNTLQDAGTLRYYHIGFYLIGDGLTQLEKMLDLKLALWEKIGQFCTRWALALYLGFITFIILSVTIILLANINQHTLHGVWILALGIIIAICSSQLAVSLVNLGVTLLVKPKPLPKMDFSEGIPAEFSTLVVIPSLLSNVQEIQSLVEALEIRFLGNRYKHLYFALLTDFNDATQNHIPEDPLLLALVKEKIEDLNKKYLSQYGNIFFLLHRSRQWNTQDQIWMGKERKRGKLEDLNFLLKTGEPKNFSTIVGDITQLKHIKYVITLDSDTQLPRESAIRMVGAMAHPLNRPQVNVSKQIVESGYGILQPRVAEALSHSSSNLYRQLYGNEFGIDPYTQTVSDVYQDVFHEGSYIGKGIYDVDLFQKILAGRFPDNCILSHDLLEGCYLRSGFLSDVSVYEHSPNNYLSDIKRRTRWIRGDWQIIGWLFPFVSNPKGKRVSNPLSFLSKIKILDNLRRSVIAINFMLLLILNWSLSPENYFLLSAILAIVTLPSIINIALEFLHQPKNMLSNQYLFNVFQNIHKQILRTILYFGCLAYEAWYSLNTILLALWRTLVSKRLLLEWTPFNHIEKQPHHSFKTWIAHMWIGPSVSIAVTILLILNNRFESLFFASPLLVLWFLSPLMMYKISQEPVTVSPKLKISQKRFLHKMARRTWSYFETFMTEENHWLPPDNYQEVPVEALARRTSPTNIGLSLLANLSAYDFGYISIDQVLERTKNTLKTLGALEKYRGHLYNWYNTETLEPLSPRYVSTVDSGNLAGHLLTLRQGLLKLPDERLLHTRYLDGLQDTWDVLETTLIIPLPLELCYFPKLLKEARNAFSDWFNALHYCNELCSEAEKIEAFTSKADSKMNEICEWSQKLLAQSRTLRDKIKFFTTMPALSPNITLRDIAHLSTTDDIVIKTRETITLIENLSEQTFALTEMDMSFLLNKASHLMTIGFNVDKQESDSSYYDLLSSEARLGIFVAIAQNQALQESWFSLGRLLVSISKEPVLISWSGSMFEYLMPLLVMPTYPGTLLDQTYSAVVKQQITYAKQHGIPWGISESGFNAVDTDFNYLYRAFGIPGLGLKRGLEEDLVITPYASALALMVSPQAACLNLQRLHAENATGKFGFYEAIDFTHVRLPPDTKSEIIRSFMTHHQGMIFLAFSYLLHNQPMQKRFRSDPLFQSALLLLQEHVPKPTATYLQIPISQSPHIADRAEKNMRVFTHPNTHTPQVQLLSNGNYHVMLTQAGSGYSRWKDIAITRWREDSTSDLFGMFSFLSDVHTGEFWSSTYQPTRNMSENFKTVFSEAHAEFNQSNQWFEMLTEIVVSPEDDIELRRLRIHNRSKYARTIEFTSYAEIVLSSQTDDITQPVFNNLFVETKILKKKQAILATRRRQTEQQNPPWMCHLLNVYTDKPYSLSFETSREIFIGRCLSLNNPQALQNMGELSNTDGSVLDPIVSIRCRLTLEANAYVIFDLLTGISETREECEHLIEKYRDRRLSNRIFASAWTHGQVLINQLNISESAAQLYTKLASDLIYLDNTRRSEPNILEKNRLGQSSLWGYAISGDLPIILLYIQEANNIELVRQLLQAQAYWRRKGLMVDLVILNEEHISYRQTLQEQIMALITTTSTSDHRGSIVLRATEQVPIEELVLLQSVARVILSDKRGTLHEQLMHRRTKIPVMPALHAKLRTQKFIEHNIPLSENLQFFNGLGGFSADGTEYNIQLTKGITTPAPWVNILANPNFGTLVSESGQAYTWAENAHEFRLTPWENDPIKDPSGEAYYLRDDENGLVWSPTALPCRGQTDYQTRHGFGYSVFEHFEEGVYSELQMTVALDDPVKCVILKIRNDSPYPRQLSAIGYVAWVLGEVRNKNAMHIITELSEHGVILAQNPYNTEWSKKTAFFDASTTAFDLHARTVTGDRTEFLGRNRTEREPAALERKQLSGRVGAGLDPCAAIQLSFYLAAGQSRNIIFTLGVGLNKQKATHLAMHYRNMFTAEKLLASVRQYWQQTCGMIQVKTPNPELNLLANGWLLYQILSSRLWGRTGYYQCSGAFGFRDQLQDVMSLAQIDPKRFRAHLLRCAAHQFKEGDVQHWWHPPHNRGVRTRCSDDFLWLPFAICYYVETTGDIAILNENIPFLEGRRLKTEEESYYDLPSISSESESLYQHAVRAINNALKFGAHGLPLIGSGDWNDGMNLVGKNGQGESVWLGFFLYKVLKDFAVLAHRYNDPIFSIHCEEHSKKLQEAIEKEGWDGKWYRRAYFDNGTPLGSANNEECRIDSIAQSWAVLSGAADPIRSQKALAALYEYLVNPKDNVIKLLTPPFDKSTPNPGYIEGYVPGIRENGAQYTHAAVWAAMAFAKLGEKELAWQLFEMLNPINHGRTKEEIERYKIEPYVLAGDVYSVSPHIGRGGWSWYTGSAGWMYRFIIETLLGIQLKEGNRLYLKPCIPDSWEGFHVDYTFGNTIYSITLKRVPNKNGISLDGVHINEDFILLMDDQQTHQAIVLL